jgi:hypothetical protein
MHPRPARADAERRHALAPAVDDALNASQKAVFAEGARDQRTKQLIAVIKARQLKRLPVVDAGRPLAVASARRVMEGLLREVEQEEELVRDYIMCAGYR